ncbi:MAG TPA: hypothetical protein VFN30_03505 [Chitinophagaceae bacterium]|nr:hypothetical protein [Chitinophagaceae bacterium]
MQKNILYFIISLLVVLPGILKAQVSSVEFGKNRVQYKKLKWRYYQSENFNIFFAQNGLELAKFAVQVAEEELPDIEKFVEYGLQRRANLVLYNTYDEFQQSNIGLGIDWQTTGGITKLVNNKAIIYYTSDHALLRKQIREAIARILVENILFGDDIGEIASNQALLDLPKWLTDGYIAYAAENWSTKLDDELKSAMLGGDYKNFYHFAFDRPLLAGHAFWNFIEENYKKENVTYLLYLARIYKNLNQASEQVCKKKFKDVMAEFMQVTQKKYYEDIRARKNIPKGRLTLSKEVTNNIDYIRFEANPNEKSFTYAFVEYKKGIYRVILVENFVGRKVLWKNGVKNLAEDVNPNYPILAWDPRGTRLAVITNDKGKINFFVYDLLRRLKVDKQVLSDKFDQVQDMKYMLDANTLVFSAVKNGHSDIFVYKIREQKLEQITNDVYDDIDPSFAAFPNKSGILYSSNRPFPESISADTVLPSKNRYNIFLVDNWNKSEFKQISKLTEIKFGNARFPSQYNTNHFTFVSDENGVGNRYAGFFRSRAEGIDTIVFVGDEILRNPEATDLDSALKSWNKEEPDSVSYVAVTFDSTYTFPITNYQSSLLESRISGDKGQVTEVTRQGAYKYLYKLKTDENVLRKRNVNARPTEYIKRLLRAERISKGEAIQLLKEQAEDTLKQTDFFRSEFANEKADSVTAKETDAATEGLSESATALKKSKLFPYIKKFSADYAVVGFNNNVLVNRFQPYQYGNGPIQLANDNALNGLLRVGISDLLEDYKFIGAIRPSTDLKDNELMFSFLNLKRRLDWGLTYYRSSTSNEYGEFLVKNTTLIFPVIKTLTQIYQLNLTYPFNKVQSLRYVGGLRVDKFIPKPSSDQDASQRAETLKAGDTLTRFVLNRVEFVHDNTLNPAINIWKGLRYKVYMDFNVELGLKEQLTYNVGIDARHYLQIYRNFIWAVRGALDISWGTKKLIYYLGGVDGWLTFGNNIKSNGEERYFTRANMPDPDQDYAYQTLAVNLRGYKQNAANGNNAFVLNSEFRLPVFSTFINRPINNAFLRNLQIVQFFDIGTAWNGRYDDFKRPTFRYTSNGSPVTVLLKQPGFGPFVAGYGFGARSTLLGYFLRFDAGWPVSGFFKGKPQLYLALGFDF